MGGVGAGLLLSPIQREESHTDRRLRECRNAWCSNGFGGFVYLDSEPIREYALGGGESDEEDEGKPARAQEHESSHYGGLPVYPGET